MNRIEVRASAAPAHLLRCSNSHYDCGSQLSNRGNRQYEMKLLYWMAAASEGRQPLSITAKMRIAGPQKQAMAPAVPRICVPMNTARLTLVAPGTSWDRAYPDRNC